MNFGLRISRKRALSPILITLLIIIGTMLLIILLWNPVQKWILSSTSESSGSCITLSLSIISANNTDNSIVIKRNPGEGNLVGVKIVTTNSTGSVVYDSPAVLDILEQQTLKLGKYASGWTKVSVAPVIDSGGKDVICPETPQFEAK